LSKLIFIFLLALTLNAKTFTLLSYNVENLFDLNYDKTEYKEYIPNTKSLWNKKTFDIKLANLQKVLEELDADIVALQEIENENLVKLLQKKLPQYKYYDFKKYKNSSVGLAVLSKIEIKSSTQLNVKFTNKTFRPIQELTFLFENNEFKVFNNHWPSKRSSESYRIKYAKTLFDRISTLAKDYDYILVGDFNSNYNEFETLKFEEKLNDSYNISGINQVLNTTLENQYISLSNILDFDRRVHYNLWLDLDYDKRFSTIYRGQNNTPDNILIPPALFDNKNLSYRIKSFTVYTPNYLYSNKKIHRWEIRNGIHKAKGYSDHLPILASFSTDKLYKNSLKNIKEESLDKISQLYTIENLPKDIEIKEAIVIYKDKNNAILKQKNDRAIYFYNNAQNLTLGFSYNLTISKIKSFFGLKEVIKFDILENNGKIDNFVEFYIDGNTIDLEDLKYQNEIITNLSGVYKKGKLYFKDKKIKIYFKDKNLIPKDDTKLSVNRAQLGYYKSQVQLIIHNKSDIDVN